MRKASNYIIILTMVSVIFSCADQEANDTNSISYSELKKSDWLIGKWQYNSSEGNATEIWEKKNDSLYVGESYFIIGQDTVQSEQINLEQHGSALLYIPTVKDQNNGKPVKFTLTLATSKLLVFENPAHDFPQKISYTKIASDSLVVEVSGMMEGQEVSQKLPMSKSN
ncbi:MAG: hypothetical protein HRT57_17390 [Crocinitomicaceae bacterium]|nr:hypothetical protein [Crocinitomicaceae bacterium]